MNDRWELKWTGFYGMDSYAKIIGKWIAHPIYKGKIVYDSLRFSCQSTVTMLVPDNVSGMAYSVVMNSIPSEEANTIIQYSLDTLLEVIEKGEYLAEKHKIPGTVPWNNFEGIDRRLLSQHLRRCRREGLL